MDDRETRVAKSITARVLPHLQYKPQTPPASQRLSPAEVLATSVLYGLVAGFAEVAWRIAWYWFFDHRVLPHESRKLNWHWAWMTPLSTTILFAASGCVFALAARRFPRLSIWLAQRFWGFLLGLGLAFTVRGLFPWAYLLVALGFGFGPGSWIRLESARVQRFARRGLPALGGVAALFALVQGTLIASHERRTIAALPPVKRDAPNVLLIVLDTVRAQSLSVYGYERDTTPNLKRLAERGVRFDQARSPGNWTLTSHASMFTGHWPHEQSASINKPLDGRWPTVAESMRDNGYVTAGFVANIHFTNAWYGLARGFAHYEDILANQHINITEILRSANIADPLLDWLKTKGIKMQRKSVFRKYAPTINKDALAWLDKTRGAGERRPFFMFLNYLDAHGPYVLPANVPPRYPIDQADLDRKIAQIRADRMTSDIAAKRPFIHVGSLGARPDDTPELTARLAEIARLRTDAYDSCLAYLDEHIGRLMDELERRGELDRTVVIITSDHGEHHGEHGFFDHGNTLYRPLIHVPLLVFGPGVPRGEVVSRPVSLRTAPASICEFAGISNHPFPGKPLSRAWLASAAEESASAPFEPVMSEVEHITSLPATKGFPPSLGWMAAAVGPTHTYIRHDGHDEQLYDIEADPKELRDLIDNTDLRSTRDQMRQTLNRLRPTTSKQ